MAFDFSGWDELLKKHVKVRTESGVRFSAVNYPAMKKDANYSKLVSELKKFSPDSLKSREEKLAFWINLYNVFAVKMVQDHFPVESIKDAGSFFNPVWDKEVGVVGGKKVTLSEIEHEILRKMGEPRIHVAIVCASVSCPDLRKEIYTAENLDAQLDDQVKRFLENRGKGLRIEREDSKVFLSSIFKWFKEDFDTNGGVLAFVSRYVSEKDATYLKDKKLKISYLSYDWNLNSL
ncbi:MAG: DUF547 domain-containing protein [Nitrospinales bacterium]